MNIEYITPGNITFTLGILGIIFTVYSYFRQPDIDADKKDALLDFRLTAIEKNLTNDLPHIDAQIKDIHNDLSKFKMEISNSITKLSTIIEERIPKK